MASVLILEDEKALQRLYEMILSVHGHTCVCTDDGIETVAKYRDALTAGNRFDVVILDLTIPEGTGGSEAVSLLQQVDPNVKAVVTSGDINDPRMENPTAHGFVFALPKPFGLVELSEAVEKAMG